MESIFSESAPQIKALVRSPSAFSTLFAPGKSWDNVRSTTAPYTESRLTRSVANERVGFPVVEQELSFQCSNFYFECNRHARTKGKIYKRTAYMVWLVRTSAAAVLLLHSPACRGTLCSHSHSCCCHLSGRHRYLKGL
jgi:hypothetical protein